MFPVVYFFFPETRYRSLEEMDAIFKKSHGLFDVVSHSLKEPHRYDKYGQLKPEYVEEALHRESTIEHPTGKFESDKSTNDSGENKATEQRLE